MTVFTDRIQAEIERDTAERVRHGWHLIERTEGGHTIGDLVSAIMRIDNPTDARAFFESYVEWMRALPADQKSEGMTEEQVAQANIGWCFGEGMPDDRRAMWRDVSNAAHPVFGSMVTRPTPEEAYESGRRAARGAG